VVGPTKYELDREERRRRRHRGESSGVCWRLEERLKVGARALPIQMHLPVSIFPVWFGAVGRLPAVGLCPVLNPLMVSKPHCCWTPLVPYRDLHLSQQSHYFPENLWELQGSSGCPGLCPAMSGHSSGAGIASVPGQGSAGARGTGQRCNMHGSAVVWLVLGNQKHFQLFLLWARVSLLCSSPPLMLSSTRAPVESRCDEFSSCVCSISSSAWAARVAESHPLATELHPAMQKWLLGETGGICKQLLNSEDLSLYRLSPCYKQMFKIQFRTDFTLQGLSSALPVVVPVALPAAWQSF